MCPLSHTLPSIETGAVPQKGVQVGVLADDLSGALNIGVEFSAAGLRTSVVQDWAEASLQSAADVLIIDTETRSAAPPDAAARVALAAGALQNLKPSWVVKKIDSLLRGPIGVELAAVMDVFAFESCLLCAASPRLGRQTIGGYHVIDGLPLAQKLAELDPTSDGQESGVPGLLARQSTRPIRHLDLDLLGQDYAGLVDTLRTMQGAIIVTDCCHQQDLNRVVAAAADAGIRFFAGTYGLGEALRPHLMPPPRPLLVVIGSLSKASTRQVARLCQDEGFTLVDVDYTEDFLTGSLEAFARPYAERLQAAHGRDTVLKVSSAQAPALWAWAAHHADPQAVVSRRIDELLRFLLVPVLADYGGIIASGGSTATAVFQVMAAQGLRLGPQEVIAGVPSAVVSGGVYDGLLFIAKPGSQGTDLALVDLVRFARYSALHSGKD